MSATALKTPMKNVPEPVAENLQAQADTKPSASTKAQADSKPVKARTSVRAGKQPASIAPAARKPAAKTASETRPVSKAKPSPTRREPAKIQEKTAKAKATATKTKPGTQAKEVKEKKHTDKKAKLIRDSFTFPAADYARIGALKQRALKAGHEVKKSELLRAGLIVLSVLSDTALLQALGGIDKLKPGRPAK